MRSLRRGAPPYPKLRYDVDGEPHRLGYYGKARAGPSTYMGPGGEANSQFDE